MEIISQQQNLAREGKAQISHTCTPAAPGILKHCREHRWNQDGTPRPELDPCLPPGPGTTLQRLPLLSGKGGL